MKLFPLLAGAGFTLSTSMALAAPNVWTVESAATNAYAELFGPTGSVTQQIALGSDIDPRGIAIVGNTGYVSARLQDAPDSLSGVIRTFNVTTGAVIGTFATAPLLGSLSYDGAGFWANDNGGGNQAFHVTLAGVTDKQVTLANCGGDCSGLEYFNRGGSLYLIANRGAAEASATYDLYNVTGVLVQAAVLSNVPFGTGIGYDTTADTFVVASSSGNDGDLGSVLTYSYAGALLSTTALGGPVADTGFGNTRYLTDVAFVPEPVSLALLAGSLAAFGLVRRRA